LISEEKTADRTLDPRFAERLRGIYKLGQMPKTLDEFGRLLVLRTTTNPRLVKLLERIKSGNAAIGECDGGHGYSMTLRDGRRVEVMCGYDALMTSVFQRKGDVEAECPHCGEKMKIQIEQTRVSKASPPAIVFWLGAGPKDAPGNTICDHLHLFPNDEHQRAWVRSRRDELGVSMTLAEVVEFLASAELAVTRGT